MVAHITPHRVPEFEGQAARVDLINREVLGNTYLVLNTEKLQLMEDFTAQQAEVTADVIQTIGEVQTRFLVKGSGVGLVDAYFAGMFSKFAPEYPTLNSINIVDFSINTRAEGMVGVRSDAVANAVLVVRNSEGHRYAFSARSLSISQSSTMVVQDTFRFFVNSERAYVQMKVALEDAKKRGRYDLIERYTNQMATLVQATSYENIAKG